MSNSSDNFATQSSALATLATRRRHANALDHHNDRTHRPTPTHVTANQLLGNPDQPLSSKDFHLDTFFNPVWMSGPHVFSFAKGGTVLHPKTYRSEPYPGYRTSAALSLGRNARYSATSSSTPSFLRKPGPRAMVIRDKPWKQVAITEQDDAECAEVETKVEIQAQLEARGKLIGLVHTWPPKLLAACTKCAVLGESRRMTESVTRPRSGTGTAVPELSCGSSGETESESETQVATPCQKEVTGEKGFGRLRRKAPPPLLLAGPREGEGESGWTLSGTSWVRRSAH